MPTNAVYLEYDTGRYPFARILETEVFRIRPLERMHAFLAKQKARSGGDGQLLYRDNLALRNLMQRLPDDSNFYRTYHQFVLNEVAVHCGRKFCYSAHPKMRVHLAGTDSVSLWHRDVDVTGRVEQINAFLPFTNCSETNALWCESTYGAKDFQPIPLRYGQLLLFDGGGLSHGSVDNVSDKTRVSLDFRFSSQSLGGRWSGILAGRPDGVFGR